MKTDAAGRTRISTNRLIGWSIAFFIVFVVAISLVASSSSADPTDVAPGSQSLVTSIVNASVIVFREGLEAVLIFAAITASFLGKRQGFRRPVMLGVAGAFAATIVTWFVMTAIVGSLPVSEDMLLAITGLAAVIVLLLVMNWFFHKVYWTDHIKELNAKKRELVDASEQSSRTRYWGFVALGFTAVYREGFEVVLFLQNLNLVAGGTAVFWGVVAGLAGTTVVGFLTFYLHHKLPYKRMLVLTGVLLGVVLVVMVGGSARTMQSLGWLSTTPLGVAFPDWWARWFEVVATVETLLMQLGAAVFVVGSYYAAEWMSVQKRAKARAIAQVTSREPVTAQKSFTATSALPELNRIAPNVASSPAAVRGVQRAQGATDTPQTVCGHEATTLCGADASVATVQAAQAAEPVRPVTHAPAFTQKPLFDAGTEPTRVANRPALQFKRASLIPSNPSSRGLNTVEPVAK